MKQLSEQELRLHILIVAGLLIATNSLLVLAGLGLFALLAAAVGLSRDAEAALILPIVAAAIPALLIILAVPGLTAGLGLLARKSWARILAIVAAVLGLPSFPIGTIIGIYAIFVLMQDAAAGYFAQTTSRAQYAAQPR
jgi:hypothetical protein